MKNVFKKSDSNIFLDYQNTDMIKKTAYTYAVYPFSGQDSGDLMRENPYIRT